MWEAIQANQRRSVVLVVLMGILLVALGGLVGAAFEPKQGWAFGLLAAAGVWLVLWLLALFAGDSILLATAGAREIGHDDAPQLFNVVEEMKIASSLEAMPKVYIIPDEAPNAFAIGRKPEKSAVAVTSGLLRILNRDELQGVVAHEIGHLKNRDTAFLMLVGVMLGAIVLIADVFRRTVRFGGRRRSSSREGGGAQALVLVAALLLAILAPLLARMIYFACSRRREYLADASGARFTRYPEGLASALEKLSVFHQRRAEVNRVLAPMYIVNPMSALAAVGLFSTHPPTDERIRILRSMGGGAAYTDYEAAFKGIVGRACIGPQTLRGETAPVAVRAKSEERETRVQRSREVIDLVGRLGGMIALTCACGVGIKAPPGLGRDLIVCPRCGAENRLPHAEAAQGNFAYKRRGTGWESFPCPCGRTIQLSPSFGAPAVKCDGCGRPIRIE
jgi:heat shock protein HtpX